MPASTRRGILYAMPPYNTSSDNFATPLTQDGIHELFTGNRFYRDTGAVRGAALA